MSSFRSLVTNPKLRLAAKVSASLVVPTIPIAAWYYSALEERRKKTKEVRTRVRVPNVETVDDLMIEKCRPGDVVLFDRRCHNCAAGPMAAFSCIVGKQFLCDDRGRTNRLADIGSFEHVGIIVPGTTSDSTAAEQMDPSNLYLLEATASDGIVARPLLTRLEMSQSRSILLLPLAPPGERRNREDNDDTYEPHPKTKRMRRHLGKALVKFRDTWVKESQKQNYASGHATLGIIGAFGYLLGLSRASPAPVSPSAWLVVSALQEAGVGTCLTERTALESRVEGFLRDHRFHEGDDVVRLRPGWSFNSPVVMRETARSNG